MHPLRDLLDVFGLVHPVTYGIAVVAASLLVLWRVEAMLDRGMEGTALGTLVLPYCSGLGNLVFVFLVLGQPNAGQDVVINSLVNNVTNCAGCHTRRSSGASTCSTIPSACSSSSTGSPAA